ncbi:MAG: diguanylate cyclase [Candidatus Omnitrophica bacterium]|nr:diguanylate cyclase [Candidatus Omnitrophota bacterium]
MVESKGKKILLASNDTNCAEIIIMLIKSWGYDVLWTKDGTSAFELISRVAPDLIIIDCDLPGLDGFGVIKLLKSDYHNAHIPLLLMIRKKNVRRDILQIEQGLDDYLTKPPDPIDLEVRIEMALRRTEHQFFANPLSKLPGSRMLEKTVQGKLAAKQTLSFLYCDINNFKSFNDKYGYKLGDAVIMQTVHIITSAVKQFGQGEDFLFHIGGDDFVVITQPQRETNIARFIIDEFDKLILFHYSVLDRNKGFIRIKDRLGKIINFPLMGLSIAIVNNLHRNINNLIEFVEIAFEIKSYLKKHKHSRSLVNRRKTASKEQAQNFDEDKEVPSHRTNRLKNKAKSYKPLGQILLDKKLINPRQLESALLRHWNTNMHLGQVLVDMNILSLPRLERVFKGLNIGLSSNLP